MIDRVAFWVARDVWSVLRAAQLRPERLDALARARLARMLRTAARLPFYRQRLDAACSGRQNVLDIFGQQPVSHLGDER